MSASDSGSFDYNVSKKHSVWFRVCLAIALLFGACCFAWYFRDNAIGNRQPAQPPNQAPVAAVPREPELKPEDLLALEEQRARSRARLEAIRFVQRDANEVLDKLEQDVIVWETRLPELLKGNDGKRIAASKIRAEQIASVIEKEHVKRSRVQSLRDQLDILNKHLDRAILEGRTTYFASDPFVNDIEIIRAEARIKSRELRELKLIVDTLQADSAAAAPAEKSLQTIIDELHAEQLRQRAASVAKVKQQSFDQGTKQLADAEAKAEQELTQARQELLRAKTEAEREMIEQIAAETRRRSEAAADAERTRIEKLNRAARFDARYPGMQGHLTAFTSPGFTQFNGGNLVRESAKGPMSLSKLRPHLSKEVRVMEEFVRTLSRHNDRPLGAFPRYRFGYNFSTREQELWNSAQDFLAEFGDIMVERKLLAP